MNIAQLTAAEMISQLEAVTARRIDVGSFALLAKHARSLGAESFPSRAEAVLCGVPMFEVEGLASLQVRVHHRDISGREWVTEYSIPQLKDS